MSDELSSHPARRRFACRRHVSLAPGFSRVTEAKVTNNRFNGFSRRHKQAAEAAEPCCGLLTRLKPGANEIYLNRLWPFIIHWSLRH